MALFATNVNKYPATTIDFAGNDFTVTLGNSMSVNVGIANSVFLGAKTSLTAGVSTNLTLGTATNFTFGNVISAAYGASWTINNSNNTSYDMITKFGVSQNVYAGGVSDETYALRITEEGGLYGLRKGIIVAYIALVGLSLFGMEWPPFAMTGEDDDGNATNVELKNNSYNLSSLIGEAASIVVAAVIASHYAEKFWKMKDFNPVANMRLDSAGINSEVYTYPDGVQPIIPPGIENPNAPPLNAIMGPKVGFYMRPSAGIEQQSIVPGTDQRRVYISGNKTPEIELFATSGSGPLPFSQIFMPSGVVSIGASLANVPDVVTPGPVTTMKSNAAGRSVACGPKIKLDLQEQQVYIQNDVSGQNTITIGPLQTTIKRAVGTVNISAGATLSSLVLDPLNNTTLASAVGAIAINNTTGETAITALGLPVASFTAAKVTLTSGPNSINFSADGVSIIAIAVEVN